MGLYDRLEEKGRVLEKAFTDAIDRYKIPACINRVGSLMSVFFTEGPVETYGDVENSDLTMFKKYFAFHVGGRYLYCSLPV